MDSESLLVDERNYTPGERAVAVRLFILALCACTLPMGCAHAIWMLTCTIERTASMGPTANGYIGTFFSALGSIDTYGSATVIVSNVLQMLFPLACTAMLVASVRSRTPSFAPWIAGVPR